jgi:tetratricopeptide (TPR) repeat protein
VVSIERLGVGLESRRRRGWVAFAGLTALLLNTSYAAADPPAPGKANTNKARNTKAPSKPAADKPSDKAATDKAAADKAAGGAPADKADADKPASDKVIGDKVAADKALPEAAGADKAATDAAPAAGAGADKAAAPGAPAGPASMGGGVPTPDPGASEPSPEVNAEARRRFDRGIEMYADGDFALALIEFNRAYQLVANYRVLYNIGQVNLQLGRYADARRALEAYVKQGGSDVSPERASSVQKDLAMLEQRTAFLTVTTNVPGAEILLDDIKVGIAPLAEPLLVDAGLHRISARKSGYMPKAEQMTLAGADEGSILITLEVVPTSSKTIVVQAAEEDTRTTLLIAGWSGTGVLAAGAVITGVLGKSKVNDLEEMRATRTTQDELDKKSSSARTMLIASDAMSVGALILGGISLWYTLTPPSEPEKRQNPGDMGKAAGLDWNVDFGVNDVRVRGTF